MRTLTREGINPTPLYRIMKIIGFVIGGKTVSYRDKVQMDTESACKCGYVSC